jgi:mono/diheme cytochrome c family protein
MISRFARTWRGALLAFASVAGLGLTACHRDMYDQPKFMPNAFDDGSTFYTGKMGNALATSFPMPVTPRLVARGREMFNIECTACHGRDGYGDGIVVQRGFPQPPSYHIDRLRQAPVGHFFVVITDGYGAMYPFGSRISPADRWAIVAYIRALQFSQDAPSGELTDADRAALEKNK